MPKVSIFLIALGFACSSGKYQTGITGHYENEEIGRIRKIEKRYFEKTVFSKGESLDLKPDCTFRYTTCGNFILGKWSATDDTIFLYCNQNIKKRDSSKSLCSTEPLAFHIRKTGNVFHQFSINIGGKELRGVTSLVKKAED